MSVGVDVTVGELTVHVSIEGQINVLTDDLGLVGLVRAFVAELQALVSGESPPAVSSSEAVARMVGRPQRSFACNVCGRQFASPQAVGVHQFHCAKRRNAAEAEALTPEPVEDEAAIPPEPLVVHQGNGSTPRAVLICEDCEEEYEVSGSGSVELARHCRLAHNRAVRRAERTPKPPVVTGT